MHPYLRDRGPSGEETLSAHTGVRLSRRTSGRAHIPLAGAVQRTQEPASVVTEDCRQTLASHAAYNPPSAGRPAHATPIAPAAAPVGSLRGCWAQPAPPRAASPSGGAGATGRLPSWRATRSRSRRRAPRTPGAEPFHVRDAMGVERARGAVKSMEGVAIPGRESGTPSTATHTLT